MNPVLCQTVLPTRFRAVQVLLLPVDRNVASGGAPFGVPAGVGDREGFFQTGHGLTSFQHENAPGAYFPHSALFLVRSANARSKG